MKDITYDKGTLFDIINKTCEAYPNDIAYEFMGKKNTYHQFQDQILTCAKSLVKLGVKEDDIVCIAMPNVPQAIIMFYAVNRIGAVCNMIHPLSSEQEMLGFLNRVNCKTLLIMDQFYDSVRFIRKDTPVTNLIIASVKEVLPLYKKLPYSLTMGRAIKRIEKNEDIIFWSDFVKLGNEKVVLPITGDRTDKMAVILHSGGTTGKIKGVCLSNMSINACVTQILAHYPIFRRKDKMLSVMPIFHGNGLVLGIHLMLKVGVCCILIPRFTPKSYVHDLLKYKCNYMSGVPALYEKMIEQDEIQNADLSFLKGVFSGADSLPVELERKINAFLISHNATVSVKQGYGMTEGVVATTLMPVDSTKEGSIGKPLPGVRVKIVEPGTTKEVKSGETGEITFSSATNMMGYYKDEDETAITLKKHDDGFTYIHSGDLGKVDNDGYFFFEGRIKRIIITNGYNVFPLEIENIIAHHEKVDNVCVVGVPDPHRGERVKACIILKHGVDKTDATKNELKEYFRKTIARYAVPRDIEFFEEFPKTKVGKVDYQKLIY